VERVHRQVWTFRDGKVARIQILDTAPSPSKPQAWTRLRCYYRFA